MINNLNTKKAVNVNLRNRLINRRYKIKIKALTLKFKNELKLIKEPSKIKCQLLLNNLYSLWDKTIKKNIYHKNKAKRKKAQIMAYYNKIFVPNLLS